MHVDGFRFDLAATLARELHEVDRLSTFFDLIHQDPIVSQVKLIAEPWDVGEGGYQVGNFPPLWSEWNGRYRDVVRDYWRGEDQTLGEFASRFTGSSDLYETTGRRPYASINFITAHDGFTLADLVSYNHKHNEANLEDNRDGTDDNRSWNSGVEGPTDEPEVCEVRNRRRRALMATLLLSQGVPMIVAGDEMGRTQGGNNNAYAQDNEISWLHWDSIDEPFLAFTRRLIEMRRTHPVFRRRRWFQGRRIYGTDTADIAWFSSRGRPMTEKEWSSGFIKTMGVFVNGSELAVSDEWGRVRPDDTFYLAFNAHIEPVEFTMPPRKWGQSWIVHLDSAHPAITEADDCRVSSGGRFEAPAWSVVVLRRTLPEPTGPGRR
jgi:glycogen operon protein